MERDFEKFAEYLAKNAREGVILERKIAEWKRAEQKASPEINQENMSAPKAS